MVNVNGEIKDSQTAVISVFDHGLLFGDGVYETLRTYNHRPFLLERHLDRLRASAQAINLPVSLTNETFRSRIDSTVRTVGTSAELYIRLLHTRGTGNLTYDPKACLEPTSIIIVKPHNENSADVLNDGIEIIVSKVLRNHQESVNPKIKSNNLLNNALAMQEALRSGAQEALMLNHRGELSECAQANFFLVRHGMALTPSVEAGLLEGVTRNFVFTLGALTGIPVRASILHDADLAEAEEMFITSTTREIVPVTKIGGRPVGTGQPGQITTALMAGFRQRANELSRE